MEIICEGSRGLQQFVEGHRVRVRVCSREHSVIPFSAGNVNETFCHAKVAVHEEDNYHETKARSSLSTMAFTATTKDNRVNRPRSPAPSVSTPPRHVCSDIEKSAESACC